MDKYKEIMSRVSVTPQMRQRVLSGLEDHRKQTPQTSAGRPARRRSWIRWVPAAAAACFILVFGLQIYQSRQPLTGPDTEVSQGLAEYSSVEELEAAVGFDVPQLQDLPFEVTGQVYTDAFGIARIDYQGGSGENISLSKGIGDGTEVSGDYNEYDSVTEESIGGIELTLKGDGSSMSLAQWTDGEYAYAISADPGLSRENMIRLFSLVRTQS